VDAIFDSISVGTTYKKKLAEWASSSARSVRRRRSIRAGREVSGLGGSSQRQLLRCSQRGRVQRRAPSCTSRRA
jgi:hypothetical protein